MHYVPSIAISISPITFWDMLGMLVLSSSESELKRIRILFLLWHTFRKCSSSLAKDPSISPLSMYSELSLVWISTSFDCNMVPNILLCKTRKHRSSTCHMCRKKIAWNDSLDNISQGHWNRRRNRYSTGSHWLRLFLTSVPTDRD